VSNVDEPQKRAVVLDCLLPVTRSIGDGGKVIVQPRVARINRDGPAQEIARLGGPVFTLGDEGEVDERLDVSRVGGKRDHEFVDGGLSRSRVEQRDAQVVVRLRVTWIDLNGATELPDRLVHVPPIPIEQAEIVVDFRARFVLFEERAVLCERVVEVADALVIEGQAEVIGRDRRGRCGRRRR